MFTHDIWRQAVARQLASFAAHPQQAVQISGAATALGYLAARTVAPFIDAFQRTPTDAVLALSELVRGASADTLVRQAARSRPYGAAAIERDLLVQPALRAALDPLFVELRTLVAARSRLNAVNSVWLTTALTANLAVFPNEFALLRRVIVDAGWETRYASLRNLRNRTGRYTAADLVLIHDGFADSAPHVRAAAARALAAYGSSPPPVLIKALVRAALHDADAETRLLAARALGTLRQHLTTSPIVEHIATALTDDDGFVRAAAAMTLGQLGSFAATPAVVRRLLTVLYDADLYARETATRTLGQLGAAAATAEVIAALTALSESEQVDLYEAATDALSALRECRGNGVAHAMV